MATEASTDTICAVASPPGGAARGVVRICGTRAAQIASARLVASGGGAFEPLRARPRGAFEAHFFDGRGRLPTLVLWMPGPRSYTGEDVVELHLPGATALLDAVLAALVAEGARPARAGEFTRRAFENGRLDLSRAEGVLELTRARGEDERRAGLALLSGGLSTRVAALRDALVELCSLCEASLDFDESETGHVENAVIESAGAALEVRLLEALDFERARPVRVDSGSIVLLGPPNAGKSRLFNALTGREALVAASVGTTRDALSAELELGDVRARLFDLPGFHGGGDALDRAAQELASAALTGADLVLVVLDATRGTQGAERALAAAPTGVPRWLVWNQVDRAGAPPLPAQALVVEVGADGASAVSAATGAGLDELRVVLSKRLAGTGLDGGGSAAGALSREVAARHRSGLEEALATLRDARAHAREGWPLDAVASTLRSALDALDRLSGRSTPEDLLDRIFARFCLGK